jgi:hypothetical protein
MDTSTPEDWALYVMATADAGRHRFVKVGISSDVGRRVTQVQVGCPLPITFLWVLQVGDEKKVREAEKSLHESLAQFHSSGEWFAIDMADASHKDVFDRALAESLYGADIASRKWERHDAEAIRELINIAARRRVARRDAKKAKLRPRYVNTKVLDF